MVVVECLADFLTVLGRDVEGLYRRDMGALGVRHGCGVEAHVGGWRCVGEGWFVDGSEVER